jgi:hypothetical protein
VGHTKCGGDAIRLGPLALGVLVESGIAMVEGGVVVTEGSGMCDLSLPSQANTYLS